MEVGWGQGNFDLEPPLVFGGNFSLCTDFMRVLDFPEELGDMEDSFGHLCGVQDEFRTEFSGLQIMVRLGR